MNSYILPAHPVHVAFVRSQYWLWLKFWQIYDTNNVEVVI